MTNNNLNTLLFLPKAFKPNAAIIFVQKTMSKKVFILLLSPSSLEKKIKCYRMYVFYLFLPPPFYYLKVSKKDLIEDLSFYYRKVFFSPEMTIRQILYTYFIYMI